MKQNGFVQAVTLAIDMGFEHHWSLYYYTAGGCQYERELRSKPMLTKTDDGPEHLEFCRMVEDVMSECKPNPFHGLKKEEIIS